MRWPTDIKFREQADRLQQAGRAWLAGCQRARVRGWLFSKINPRGSGSNTEVTTAVGKRPGLEAEKLAGRLLEEKEFLLALIQNMEAEFLGTGGGLMSLSQQLGEIRKQCQMLTELTLGQSQDAAVQFAFQLLKKAEDLVLASYEQYDHVFATFSELQQRLAQLSGQHNDLMRVLLPLNFITMSFRIEASRHPIEVQQLFFTLADTVNRTVNEVRRAMEQQFTELVASERIARNMMEQISASIQQHRKAVTVTLETSRSQLHVLSEALTHSGAGANDLADLNQSVNRHINSIVMAQQCQDMTRQQIEHVGAAMTEMGDYLGEALRVSSATGSEAREFVARAGRIQLHQVQNVFDQLNQAANGLTSGIQSLRTEAGTAAEVAVKVGGATLDAKAARQCQAGIGEILDIVKQSVQKIADIIAAFAPLQASFVDCTSKASALAGDVRHAGLNAQIFAIHAPNGATLEVLAGRMRTISEEVIEQVGHMGAALNHTTEMVNNLRQRLEDFQILGQMEQENLAAESDLSQKKLSDLETAIPLLIQHVTQQQGTFAQAIEAILANVQFPATVAAASARSIGFFHALVAWGSSGGFEFSTDSAASGKIDRLLSKYTMESERRTHAAALQPVLATTAATAMTTESAIEMFEDFTSPAPDAADAPVEIVHASKPLENHPAAPALTESETSLLAPLPKPVPEKTAATSELGDNVELF